MSVTKSTSGTKTYFTTQNPIEIKFGYHRAVRKGPFIFVSGTTAINPGTGTIECPDSADSQARTAFQTSLDAVEKLGGRKEDVVRVRMFVARQQDTGKVGEAFRDYFGSQSSRAGEGQTDDVGCAATMIVINDGFVDPSMLVEVEVDAVI